jgi:hypothetical protein
MTCRKQERGKLVTAPWVHIAQSNDNVCGREIGTEDQAHDRVSSNVNFARKARRRKDQDVGTRLQGPANAEAKGNGFLVRLLKGAAACHGSAQKAISEP